MTDPTPSQPAARMADATAHADASAIPHARTEAAAGTHHAVRPGQPNGDERAAVRERAGGSGADLGMGHSERLRFLGAATRRIARGLDLDETILGLCRATVPAFCDAILVYLRHPLPVGDEQPQNPYVLRLRRTDRLPDAIAAQQGGGAGPILHLVTDAVPRVEISHTGALAEVLRAVRPVFADTALARAALRELVGKTGPLPEGTRAIVAPLRGRRRVTGAAVFLRRPDRVAFEQDDLQVAQQLSTHSALGVDKALLYDREATIADDLQRTMLPDDLPQPTGVRLASRYLPSAESARVGGDWYDAIPLPGSRVALVVGDVMGHSTTSAAIMGQLRTTVQTLAGLDLPPQEVLHHLDEQAQRLGENRMATCLYAVYDPVAHKITAANAGHPPPVLLHTDGTTELVDLQPNAPIGVGGVDFQTAEFDAPTGATLVLYTDGLVESRTRDIGLGLDLLRAKLTEIARLTRPGAAPPLQELCEELLDVAGPGDRDDDIALLAARFEGVASDNVVFRRLQAEPESVRAARRLVRESLHHWELADLLDPVELLVSEVVTNAVRYAERPVTLRLLRSDVLRCEVGDDVPQLPRLRQAGPDEEGGRGLYLVQKLARRWGATRLGTGKLVWFEMSVPAPSDARRR
ncbi:ATP-binding SpoIIE family protein phosphatase [Streptomyces aidingensis]|uniref:protein-serine/threonine phosphatase n=1 Tax=Streptomyces aidingensis TaxID=910347 RepID=A0A1I1EQ16_9ACTN|nr:Serine phosphatase RsbU, regulator of sigma subunit [Streptomyces aidingensis]